MVNIVGGIFEVKGKFLTGITEGLWRQYTPTRSRVPPRLFVLYKPTNDEIVETHRGYPAPRRYTVAAGDKYKQRQQCNHAGGRKYLRYVASRKYLANSLFEFNQAIRGP